MIARHDVADAARRIAAHVRRTPTVALDGTTVLKLELTQHTGSFKPRGAFNDVLSRVGLPAAGIIAASGGNHGQAVAYVAHKLGLTAEVFVPEVCPTLKRERIAGFGATVVVSGAIYDDAQNACSIRAAQSGAHLVHPFDRDEVMAGAGTVALEFHQEEPDLDTVLVAVGGGGLLGGTLAYFGPDIRVVAVEPQHSQALHAALAAGRPVEVSVAGVAADSLGARRIGDRPFELAATHLYRSVIVSDQAIVAAQQHLWETVRIVAEPGGATAFAALLDGVYRPEPGERVGVIICGGNVDPGTLATST